MTFKANQKVRLELHGYGLMFSEDAVVDKITVAGVWIKKPSGKNPDGPMEFNEGNEPLGPFNQENGWHNTPYKPEYTWKRDGYISLKWRIQ